MSAAEIVIIVFVSLAAAGAIIFFWWFSNSKFSVTEYEVESPKINLPFRIVHLSDLHAKRFGAKNKRLVAAVKKARPDIIVFTGDIIHLYRKPGEEAAIELVEQLSCVAPFYYVSGNHEMRYKNYREFSVKLADAGAVILENEYVMTHGVALVGLGCANLKNNKIFEITPEFDCFKILLAHEPQYLTRYARAGYDLVLSGHAHGGQWRWGRQGTFAPGQGLLPRYTRGMYKRGKKRSYHILVSGGFAVDPHIPRLNNRPELVIVDVVNMKTL